MSTSRSLFRASVCALVLGTAACALQSPTPAPGSSRPDVAVADAPPVQPVAPPIRTPGTDPLPPPLPKMSPAEARAHFVRTTAQAHGIDPAYIEATLDKAQLRESIVKAMSRPAEAKPWSDYRPIFLTDARINGGRAFIEKNREALARAEARYGVPAEIIAAIIGVETSYGANTGSFPVLDALYTLGFAYPRTGDPAKAEREDRREAFFRNELAQLFALGKDTGMDITTLKGSYAGAMGWGQFMPSSYMEYAVDGDGDGRRDLFNSRDDAFASIANYFVQKGGWVRGGPVAVRATVDPSATPFVPDALDPVYPVRDLVARGYRPLGAVPADALVVPLKLDGVTGPEYWLGHRNFYAITRYNISKHYAMAVYQLAEALAGRQVPPPPAS